MTSESWAGFTDDDIKRIKSNPSLSKLPVEKCCETIGASPIRWNKHPWEVKRLPKKERVSSNTSECNAASECHLKSTPKNQNKVLKLQSIDNGCESVPSETEHSCENRITGSDEYNTPYHGQNDSDVQLNNASVNLDCSLNNCRENQCENGSDHEEQNLPALEVFELRQKRIEAENARRRALITKAIMDKKKRTQAESIKLAKITEELHRLDSSLSADVSILRNYIEKASYEFSEAEKRYLKAEKEFVEAKYILFEKMQRKEQLTEHLCAIIEQNENRKANKLVELMKQLEMETGVEEYNTNSVQPILSSLCTLNDEAYQSCQTLKPHLPKATQDVTVPDQKISVEDNSSNTDFLPDSSTEKCFQEVQNYIPDAESQKSYTEVDEIDLNVPRSECEGAEDV